MKLRLRCVPRGQRRFVSPRHRDRMQTPKLRPLLPTCPSPTYLYAAMTATKSLFRNIFRITPSRSRFCTPFCAYLNDSKDSGGEGGGTGAPPKLLLLGWVFLLLHPVIACAQWTVPNPVADFQKQSDGALLHLKTGKLRLQVCSPAIIPLLYSPTEER